MELINNLNLGSNVTLEMESEDCKIMQIKSDDGNGIMTMHKVLDGISIIYNDFHMKNIKSEFKSNKDILCFDHCREGRIDQEIRPGVYSYTEAGDLRIDNATLHNTDFFFPLSHYHGITIYFDIEEADKSIKEIFPDFPVTPSLIRKKFCSKNRNFFLRGEPAIDHIFSELYRVPTNIRDYYFKIKIFELLLYVGSLNINKNVEERPYFYKSQIEKIKEIYRLITEDLQRHYTLEELSLKFDISLTAMKSCFKATYGDSIYAFLRKYRLNRAATLLCTTENTVADIACEVGYESPSKFSSAFKKEMNMSPKEYRNR